jgi:hypothetical protein
MSAIGPAAVRPHAVYDPRLRDLVFHAGDVAIAQDRGVPRSSASDWKNGKFRSQVVTLDVLDRDMADLQAEVLRLRRRLRVCGAMIGLLVALVRLLGSKLTDHGRLPEGKDKDRLLKSIERAKKYVPLRAALKVLGLSSARYHSWRRAQVKCELDDRP